MPSASRVRATPVVRNEAADESAATLAKKIRRGEPFFFLRYGDGAIECMSGMVGGTCDFEPYSPALGWELMRTWCAVRDDPRVLIGDWQTASFRPQDERSRYADAWEVLTHGVPRERRMHFEALLLMRKSPELLDFYWALKHDKRRKLYLGPRDNAAGVAAMLGAEFLETPMTDLFKRVDWYTEALAARNFEVLLYGAGMAGNISVARCFERHPGRTYVHLGSALDPLFGRGRTRKQQLAPADARAFLAELL